MKYKGVEVDFNRSDLLLGINWIEGVEEGGVDINMLTLGLVIFNVTWVWKKE